MKIEFDKTYYLPCPEVSIHGWSKEEVAKFICDGRRFSALMEKQIEKWFPDLKFVDEKGYDHIHRKNNMPFDQKTFTKQCNFNQSKHIGYGRDLLDEEAANEHIKNNNYIITDTSTYPMVRLIFKKGSDLLEKYPKRIIPKSKREELFND